MLPISANLSGLVRYPTSLVGRHQSNDLGRERLQLATARTLLDDLEGSCMMPFLDKT
jgi:hypothetical protein